LVNLCKARNLPYRIPESGQLLFVVRVKLVMGLWIYEDSGLELSTTEHDCVLDVGILIEERLWIRSRVLAEIPFDLL
jgi:hypothetical protein